MTKVRADPGLLRYKGRRVFTWAEYVHALRNNALPRDARMTVCPSCGAKNPGNVFVWFRQRNRCPSCLPSTRVCVDCQKPQPLAMFGTAGGRVESVCVPCRQVRQRAYYEKMQSEAPKTLPKKKVCHGCARTLSRAHFFVDHRYRDGLANHCSDCRVVT